MCIVCRRRFPKVQLSRYTRSPQGDWIPDENRTQPGRGWYLCSSPGCRERFARGRANSRRNKGFSGAS
ncbi:MAG: YlxR family protein [Betaproteobacteria bacterium]|nr:YlxR family protein [Betaproteobacteria bacterium]